MRMPFTPRLLWTPILLPTLLIAAAAPLSVSADHPSHTVSGRVYFGGQPAPADAMVEAIIDGDTVADAVTEAGGAYSMTISQPEGESYAGKTVNFTVYGLDASEELVWEEGGSDNLNLRFELAELDAVPKEDRGAHDADGDRLIEIDSLEKLYAVRYDLDGDGAADDEDDVAEYSSAFPVSDEEPVCNGGDFACYGYELGGDLDFADTKWSSGLGWLPIALSFSDSFNAAFNGNGHAISNLYISRANSFASPGAVGLFGYVDSGASILDVTLDGISITAGYSVGGLAGYNQGKIENSHAAGVISDGYDSGGLVGRNRGVVKYSSSSVSVSGDSDVGGLIGQNYRGGEVVGSFATGAVSSRTRGGFLGNLFGSYDVGGLVGHNDGEITESYATGDVSGNNWVGGLVGWNTGSITVSYATGEVSGEGDDVGGLAGHNGGAIGAAYATGRVSGKGDVGGLVGHNDDTIAASYATGRVSGGHSNGGLLGSNDGSVVAGYWDTTTSGLRRPGVGSGDASGVEGKTRTELRRPTGYTGIYAPWDFDLDNADEDFDYTTGGEDVWDFGTTRQHPALKADLNGDGVATWEEFGSQPRAR